MNTRWIRALLAVAAVLGLIAIPRSSAAEPAVRLVIERRDAMTGQTMLQAIRALMAADSELVVRTDGAESPVRFADIRLIRFESTTAGVDPANPAAIEPIRLLQNRPNPAVRSTTIGFDLARRGRVTLEVFSVSGRRVRVLVDRVLDAGHHEVAWDGADDGGRPVDAGVYFYRLKGLGRGLSRRAVIVP